MLTNKKNQKGIAVLFIPILVIMLGFIIAAPLFVFSLVKSLSVSNVYQYLFSGDAAGVSYNDPNAPDGATFGPEIAGQFYHPLGDKKANSYNSTSHQGKGHGLFETTPFEGFSQGSNGAADYNFSDPTKTLVYATFDGTIVKAKSMHISTYGRGGGVLWLKSSDQKNGAIYAHITFASGIKQGVFVKKGQTLGMIAPRCSLTKLTQCIDSRGSPHLHFQFYINQKGLTFKQLVNLFP